MYGSARLFKLQLFFRVPLRLLPPPWHLHAPPGPTSTLPVSSHRNTLCIHPQDVCVLLSDVVFLLLLLLLSQLPSRGRHLVHGTEVWRQDDPGAAGGGVPGRPARHVGRVWRPGVFGSAALQSPSDPGQSGSDSEQVRKHCGIVGCFLAWFCPAENFWLISEVSLHGV